MNKNFAFSASDIVKKKQKQNKKIMKIYKNTLLSLYSKNLNKD